MVIGGVEGKGHIGESDRPDRPGAKAKRGLGLRARSYREGLADAIEWFYKAGYFKWPPNPGSVQRPTHGRRECR
jgi:hypothetical protein